MARTDVQSNRCPFVLTTLSLLMGRCALTGRHYCCCVQMGLRNAGRDCNTRVLDGCEKIVRANALFLFLHINVYPRSTEAHPPQWCVHLSFHTCACFRYPPPTHTPYTHHFTATIHRCDEHGAALICDDVRSSMRINVHGTWADPRYGHGVQPDLTCLCKGIANG